MDIKITTEIAKAMRVTGRLELARRLGISHQALAKWRRSGRVPADRLGALIEASDHPLRASDLRPDLAEVFRREWERDRAA